MTMIRPLRLAGRALAVLTAVAVTAPIPAAPAFALDAFPGAQGYGRIAQGGRYGRIIWVDNLKDAGPGSLRACVEATGPRNCLFRVSGTIVLSESLAAVGPGAAQLSILGQTAPGGGIAITVDPNTASFRKTPLVVKNTNDVVIRHIRVRPGFPDTVTNVDAITVENSARVYVDHVSGSWATDENFNSHSQTTDLTVAYSVFGEGLRPHSKCALIGSDPTGPQDISFWRNLCISNNDRNPDNNHVRGSCIEIVDNVFYNAVSEWAEVFSQQPGGTPIAIVGNQFKAGPSTIRHTYAINWNDSASVAPPAIFADANAVWAPANKLITLVAPDTVDKLIPDPACPISVASFRDPAAAHKEILSKAGAFPRDAVDQRFVAEVAPVGVAGTGSIKSAAGPMPALAGGRAYADADGDGIADSAEARFGATAGTADMWTDGDGDGWSNFDGFMEWLSRERIAGRYPS
jgi:pectate lyase